MGVLDLHAAGIDASVRRQLNAPGPAPEPTGFSLGSFFGAAPAGVGSGGLEAAASAVDLITKETRAGNVLRRKANEWAPAETAHTADKVLHGLTRFGSKAAAIVATLGPAAGAAVLALEEGNTTAQNLRMQGVDDATAAKVGAVTGVVSGVGAVLPMAGSTVARTAGLVALGGPASYVGQEAASREILARAGYAEEAAKHDPADPLGLALSIVVPGAFGAFHARNLRRIERVQTLQNEQEARQAAQLSPDEQARSDAYERSDANLRELEQAIAKEKRPEVKATLEAELAKQRDLAARLGQEPRPNDAAIVAAADPAVVDAARVRLDADTLARAMPEAPMAHAEVRRAADAVAAGDQVDVLPMISPDERAANLRVFMEGSQVVDEAGRPLVLHHGTKADFEKFDLDADVRGVNGIWLTDSGNYAYDMAGGKDGRVLDVYVNMRNPQRLDVLAEGRRVADEAGLPEPRDSQEAQELLAGGDGWDSIVSDMVAEARRSGHDGLIITSFPDGRMVDSTAYIAFRPEQIKSATGNSGRFDPNSPSLTDPLSARASDAPAATTPFIRTPSAAPEQASPTAEPARPAPAVEGDAAAPAVDAATLQRLTNENPDMPVRLPGSDSQTTLARALAAAKEAAEEEAKEADLFKAAMECALGYGA